MFFYVVAFFLMAGGILLVLKLSPLDLLKMTASVMTERKVKLKRSIRRSIKPVRKRGIQKIIGDTRETLRINDQSSKFPRLMLISLLMSVVGILIASAMDNPFLVPVLAVSFFLLPFLFVLLTSVKSQKRMNTALETALSTITSSYLRTESIVTAVEENVEQLDPYVRPTFQRFLVQAKMISPDISALLENMKNSISNSVFHEWVDAMILCQNDRTLKSTLMPIVNKLSDIRVVSGELNTLLYEPLKDFAIMALLLLLEVPFLRSQNEEWYNILMFTPVGKLLISVDVVLLMVALIAVIRNLKPIEYRR
jgi:tight adherence protein B